MFILVFYIIFIVAIFFATIKEYRNVAKCHYIDNALEKLAKYEDLEEQGRLLKLPCKVGDTVYIIEDDCEGDPACCYHTCDSCNQRNPHIEKTKFYVEDIEGLGEYIFLTKEEAETKLKELRGME